MDIDDQDERNDSRDMDIRNEVLLSLVPGIGPRLREQLLERFGSVESILSAAPSDLRSTQGIGPKLSSRIAGAEREFDVDAELALCAQHGIDIFLRADDAYPRSLREIPDPPGLLYVQGDLQPEDALSIAVVGTRHASAYGLRQAERLGGALSRAGLTVVSGLARGVDAAAHRGALKAGGRTIAVLGSGLLRMYPPEHAKLAEEIRHQGAVISESSPQTSPQAGLFPQRNRVISGMTLGTLVIEAGDRSGALITARLAMEQGREVFALPGNVDCRTARGCHRLLRDGAVLVEHVDDILEELGPLVEGIENASGEEIRHPAELKLNEIETQVLQACTQEGASVDLICEATGLPIHQILATLSVLEMRRLVRRSSGNRFARV